MVSVDFARKYLAALSQAAADRLAPRPASTTLAMAARLIRQCEGCILHPYQDSAGNWTIGIGSIRMANGSPVSARTQPITEADAEALMQAELRPTAQSVNQLVPAAATVAQRAACTSFAYNEGVGAFRRSTLLAKWRAGDLPGAAAQFLVWDIAGGRVVTGLETRRKLEQAVWLGTAIV